MVLRVTLTKIFTIRTDRYRSPAWAPRYVVLLARRDPALGCHDACGTWGFWAAAGASREGEAARSLSPKSCRFSATTRSRGRFWPLCLSSQLSSCNRPSINTRLPLERYCPAISRHSAPEGHFHEGGFLLFLTY